MPEGLTNINIKRRPKLFRSEKSRVITKFLTYGSDYRIKNIIKRILKLNDDELHSTLTKTFDEFSDRHRNLRTAFENNFQQVKQHVPEDVHLSKERKLLTGAYFTSEYSIESAALFNPSIIPHPDQSKLAKGSLRFIMSFRATGEGHISSIEFKSGVIDKHNGIFFDPVSNYVETPEISPNQLIINHLFRLKIQEMGVANEVTHLALSRLPSEFTYDDIQSVFEIINSEEDFSEEMKTDALEVMSWLAKSNYEIKFNPLYDISERVIFPVLEHESRGVEDARFVKFEDEDGEITYYAPYTAYNGFNILPQLIETKDFVTFKIISLNGKAVQNKGMALFPRRIKGKYFMLSRQDGENNHIMCSDNIHFWQESQILYEPTYPWEFIQVGNCGSPIETRKGWLLLTHGVGPMRKYSIGVHLLDLNDPTRIIAKLHKPILATTLEERDGYVPNVVYTCGGMIHNDELIIPYGIADSRCGIATLSVEDLLTELTK